MNSYISLHCDGHSHEHRGCHHDHLSRVQEVREQQCVDSRDQLKTFAKTFQNWPEQVTRIEECQGNQQEVECVPHLFWSQDETWPKIGQDASDSHRGLDDPFQPKPELMKHFFATFIVTRTKNRVRVGVVHDDGRCLTDAVACGLHLCLEFKDRTSALQTFFILALKGRLSGLRMTSININIIWRPQVQNANFYPNSQQEVSTTQPHILFVCRSLMWQLCTEVWTIVLVLWGFFGHKSVFRCLSIRTIVMQLYTISLFT